MESVRWVSDTAEPDGFVVVCVECVELGRDFPGDATGIDFLGELTCSWESSFRGREGNGRGGSVDALASTPTTLEGISSSSSTTNGPCLREGWRLSSLA